MTSTFIFNFPFLEQILNGHRTFFDYVQMKGYALLKGTIKNKKIKTDEDFVGHSLYFQ